MRSLGIIPLFLNKSFSRSSLQCSSPVVYA